MIVGSEDGAYELALSTVHGRIWDRRPKATREGVLARVLNTRRRATDTLPVAFEALAFSGDGQTCAAADKRGHLYILYLELNRFSLVGREAPGPAPGALCFTQRRHEEVLCAAKNIVRAFDADTHRNTAVLQGHRREVRTVSASGPSGLVLTQSSDHTILWDVMNWTQRRSLQALAAPMVEARFSPVGDLCAVLFRDSRVSIWRTTTLAFERELLAPDNASTRAVCLKHFTASERHIVVAGSGELMFVWSLAHEKPPVAVELPRPIVQLQLGALSREGRSAAVVYLLQDDGRLLLAWLRSFEVVLTVDLQFRAVTTFSVSCHSKYILIAVSDGCLELRDVACAVEHEYRSVQQRIQLGAPHHLLQKSFKRRQLPRQHDEGQGSLRKKLGPTSDRLEMVSGSDGDEKQFDNVDATVSVPTDPRFPGDDGKSDSTAHGGCIWGTPGSTGRTHRSPVQPQQRGANGVARLQPRHDQEDDAALSTSLSQESRVGNRLQPSTHTVVKRSGRGRQRRRGNSSSVGGFALANGDVGHGDLQQICGVSVAGADLGYSMSCTSDGLGTFVPSSRSSSNCASSASGSSGAEFGKVGGKTRRKRADAHGWRSPSHNNVDDFTPNDARKLRGLLQRRGAYADSDRLRIWCRLLKLPYNVDAYTALEALGIHPTFQDLDKLYPTHTRSTIRQLARLLSALVHWSQAWAEVPYLPTLAFPFLKVFRKEPVLAFEAVATLLLNWARNWIDELPGPPLAVLFRLDALFASVDPTLHRHLRQACETAPGCGLAVHIAVLWPLLQTLLTEVLPKVQWMQLWDHLITHWLEPDMLLAAVVAFLHCTRASLLELPPHAPQAVEEWLRRPQKLHMPALIGKLYSLQCDAAAVAPVPGVTHQGSDGGLPLGEPFLAGEGSASLQLPLPKGRSYPTFSAHPTLASVDGYESAGRQRRAASHLASHRDQLLEIRTAVEQLTQEEVRFRQQQDELLATEEAQRQVAAEQEDQLFEEKKKAEEKLLARRLDEVRNMYEGVEQSLKQQQQARVSEGRQLLEDLQRRHRERTYEVEARIKEEALMNLEHKGMQTVTEMLMRRRDEESLRSLKTHIRARRREQELQDEVQRQAWRIEDERETAKTKLMLAQRLHRDQREAELRRRREVEMELRLEELERQLQLAQVSRERTIRRAQQDALAMGEVSDGLQQRRHELTARHERREQALAAAEERRFQRRRLEEREVLVASETKRWQLEMEVRGEQLGDVAIDQVRRDYEARSEQLREEDRVLDAAGEDELRRTLLRAEGARWLEDEPEVSPAKMSSRSSPQAVGSGEPPIISLGESGAGAGGTITVREEGLRERELEELIRQREAQLEALWEEFDAEARELAEEERGQAAEAEEDEDQAAAALLRRQPPPVPSLPVPAAVAGQGPRRRQRPAAGIAVADAAVARAGGGPLEGAWGATSDEESSSGAAAEAAALPARMASEPQRRKAAPQRHHTGRVAAASDSESDLS